jgi:hypothetical protein
MRKALLALTVLAAAPSLASVQDTALDAEVRYVGDVLRHKLVRHRLVRDALGRVFADQDGRDRFLLNLVAKVKSAGILDGKIQRLQWGAIHFDPAYGYAETPLRVCGSWYVWIPRCTRMVLRWRYIDERWILLPPDQIVLDPDEFS